MRHLRYAQVFVCVVVTLTGGCKNKAPVAKSVVRAVRVHVVQRHEAAQGRRFSGRVTADVSSALSFKVNGQIKSIPVKVGDHVEAGQVIATIDDSDLRLRLKQAQAAHQQAVAQARNAKQGYERAQKLYENRGVSLKDLEAAQAAADAAGAQVSAQRQAIALARSQVSYCSLRAPLAGEVAQVPANVNENVRAGQPVAVVNSGGQNNVEFSVPENLVASIRKGDAASVTFTALGDKRFVANVTEVGVAGGATAYPVKAALRDSPKGLRAGMAAEVTLTAEAVTSRPVASVTVPASAVMEDSGGRFVYIAKASAKGAKLASIERRAVKSGQLVPSGVEILDGLKPGDRVLTAGVRFVEPKMQVRVLGQ
ncbi:MAG: efflux RND transporter periplasmic adaptor subunit [Deltaproteobacteria bacterium]|nr:efflux RND transporter periplasmic adaptor subunit [Deltaproteobacteria bacterium]